MLSVPSALSCLIWLILSYDSSGHPTIALREVLSFPGGSVGKNPFANAGDAGWSLDWGDPLEEEIAAHSSILGWKIPWTEEPGRLQSMASQRIRHDWACMQMASIAYLLSLPSELLPEDLLCFATRNLLSEAYLKGYHLSAESLKNISLLSFIALLYLVCHSELEQP